MRLLLDECVARDLKDDLASHEVVTAVEAGFSGMKNGALLRAAAAEKFDVLITVDRNIPFQQNTSSLPIAIVILLAQGITYSALKPLVPDILTSIGTLQPGQVVRLRSNPDSSDDELAYGKS
jgi:predicted nuclease of predicted toxin-antitoxin system